MAQDGLIPVWRGDDESAARQIQSMLMDHDIEAFVTNGDQPHAADIENWIVQVPPESASYARRHVEQSTRENELQDVRRGHEQTLDDRTWRNWPTCGQCGARRMTRCGFCGSTGSEFPLADGFMLDDQVLICCDVCDEPFAPEFFQLCPECGFDFGEGLDVGEVAEPDMANPRVHLALLGLILLAGGTLAYYWFLFR